MTVTSPVWLPLSLVFAGGYGIYSTYIQVNNYLIYKHLKNTLDPDTIWCDSYNGLGLINNNTIYLIFRNEYELLHNLSHCLSSKWMPHRNCVIIVDFNDTNTIQGIVEKTTFEETDKNIIKVFSNRPLIYYYNNHIVNLIDGYYGVLGKVFKWHNCEMMV